MDFYKKNRIKIIPVVVILFGFLIAAIIITFVRDREFRVTEISPQPSSLPTSSNTVTINTNRSLMPIESQPDGFIQSNQENEDYEVSIFENSVRIDLIKVYDENNSVSFSVINLTSVQSETVSTEINYIVKYVPFNKLDNSEKQRQIDESTVSGDNNPLLSILPYDEIVFRVEGIIDETTYGSEVDWRDEKDNYVIIVNTFASRSLLPDDEYRRKTLELRQQAKNWMTTLGVDPNVDFNIIYTPSDEELAGESPLGD